MQREKNMVRELPVVEGKGRGHRWLKALSILLLLHVLIPFFTVSAHARTVTLDVKMKRSILAKDCMECHADAIRGEAMPDRTIIDRTTATTKVTASMRHEMDIRIRPLFAFVSLSHIVTLPFGPKVQEVFAIF